MIVIKDENTKYMEFITTGGLEQHYISNRDKLRDRKEYCICRPLLIYVFMLKLVVITAVFSNTKLHYRHVIHLP